MRTRFILQLLCHISVFAHVRWVFILHTCLVGFILESKSLRVLKVTLSLINTFVEYIRTGYFINWNSWANIKIQLHLQNSAVWASLSYLCASDYIILFIRKLIMYLLSWLTSKYIQIIMRLVISLLLLWL